METCLASPSLDHELAGQVGGGLCDQGLDLDGPVQRVAGHHLPVVEHGHAVGLALRVRPQVGLETERVDHRQQRLDYVQRGARYRTVLRHVASVRNNEKMLVVSMSLFV